MNYSTISTVRIAGPWMLAALALGMVLTRSSYNTIGGAVIVGLGLGILVFAILPKLVPQQDMRFMLQLLIVALVAKVAATFFLISQGLQDATRYHQRGEVIAAYLRESSFDEATSSLSFGTTFVDFVTGVVYSVIGLTLYGGFLFFSFLSFLGAVFFFRGFCIAFVSGNRRLFAVLIFLYPSLLFWPTGIGKDALMFLCLGLAAYGTALLLVRARWTGAFPLLLGISGALMVRPHMAGVLALALALAVALRRPGRGGTSVAVQVLTLVGTIAVAWFFLTQVASSFGVNSLSPSVAVDLLTKQSTLVFRTGAGSNFATMPVTNPLWVPWAFMTVLLRPFPWEAHNIQAFIQASEGMLMALLLLWGSRRLWKALTSLGREPYLLFLISIIVMNVLILSTLGNFGLLARQRVMVLPFLFMAIAFVPTVLPQLSLSPSESESYKDSKRHHLVSQ